MDLNILFQDILFDPNSKTWGILDEKLFHLDFSWTRTQADASEALGHDSDERAAIVVT